MRTRVVAPVRRPVARVRAGGGIGNVGHQLTPQALRVSSRFATTPGIVSII